MLLARQDPLQRLEGLLVADVMTRDVTVISALASMDEAAVLLKSRAVGGAPVVDRDGRCIGVLSASDFLLFDERNEGQGYAAPEGNRGAKRWQLPWNSVQRYMTTPPHTISPTASMIHAAELMCTEHVHRLIVLNDCGRPAGLVSTFDVVSAMLHAVDEDRQRQRVH